MALEHWKSEDLEFLEKFYSSGQRWSWAEISNRESNEAKHVADWIGNLPSPRGHPIVLPVRKEDAPSSSWVAIAFSEGQCEELRELLKAFVGTWSSSYYGARVIADPDDPVDQASLEWSGADRFFKFQPAPDQSKRVRESLSRMLDVLKLRPPQTTAMIRTTEGLLREFRSALLTHDQGAAEKWLSEIRQTGRLSAENLRFLRIEYYAAFGRWREMCLGSEWPLVLRGRRPRRITALMIEALWQHHFQDFLSSSSAQAAIEKMREHVLPTHRSLFRSSKIPLKPSGLLAFLLAAVADSPPRVAQIESVLEAIPLDSDERAFAELIVNGISLEAPPVISPPSEDPFVEIELSLRKQDLDTAWDLVLAAPIGTTRCKFMLECAFEFMTVESAKVVAEAIDALSDSQRSDLLSSRHNKRNWEDVESVLQIDTAPSSWEEWLDLVETQDSPDVVLETARSAIESWDIADYRNRPDRVADLSERIEMVASSEANEILQASLPYLADFFLPDSAPAAEFRGLYLSFLAMISLSDQVSNEDWSIAESMGCAVLESGPSAHQYTEMVDFLTALWDGRAELNRLSWALDFLDFLITGPNLNENARAQFFESIRNFLIRNARRISSDQRAVFELLCGDLNRQADYDAIPWPKEDDGDVENDVSAEDLIAENLKGRSVGIYTLNETAAVRAAKLIEERYENVKVRLSHDHGGSDKLKVIARDSDYLIVVTQSAKHAATNFIKDERSSSKSDLIYPKGRGTASLIQALKDAVLA